MRLSRSARRLAAVVGVAVTAVALPAAFAGSASAADTATVTVVHGIPGLPVDVYVDGAKALPDFQPKTVTDPIALPAGARKVDIRKAGDPESAAPALTATVTLPAGANASLVAHLSASGDPTLTAYVNKTSGLAAGQGRLVVRHDAAAPAVDVLAGGSAVISGLTNPGEESLDLAPATVSASVALAGTTAPVIGPADVPVMAGMVTVVYAIGSATDGTLGVLTQTVSAAPTSAASGTGGQAASGGGAPVLPLAAAALVGLVLIGTGTRVLAKARS